MADGIAFSRDGKPVATDCPDGVVMIYELDIQKPLATTHIA
jgi:hypothetical protein